MRTSDRVRELEDELAEAEAEVRRRGAWLVELAALAGPEALALAWTALAHGSAWPKGEAAELGSRDARGAA